MRWRTPTPSEPGRAGVCGLLLAAGAGRRAGGPKAQRLDPDGTSWLVRSTRVLLDGGCAWVVVVLGAGRAEAGALLAAGLAPDAPVSVVAAPDWAGGLSRSLVAGLAAVDRRYQAVLVSLVDLPDVSAAVVRRLLAGSVTGRAELCRASYSGRPGHPVLLGSHHLEPLVARLLQQSGAAADVGAQPYLAEHPPRLVECGDLATGQDQDEGS